MNILRLKQADILFDFSRNIKTPQVPSVTDVLFALQLSQEEDVYSFCVRNHPKYIVNVALVVAAVGSDLMGLGHHPSVRMDMAPAFKQAVIPGFKKVIARAIVDLCPPGAKCLLNTAYVEAKIAAGFKEWQAALNRDREIRQKTCLCPYHSGHYTLPEERQTAAHY